MLMQLTNSRAFFEISDEDFPLVCKHKWGITIAGYIESTGTRELLHRFLFGLIKNDGKYVDHKDGNKANNKRDNLRLCTNRENVANSPKRSTNITGFKGVSVYTGRKNYRVTITHNGKHKHIGMYEDLISGARAYDKWALIIFGEFAHLNFPIDDPNHCMNDMQAYNRDFKETRHKRGTSIYRGVVKRNKRWNAICCDDNLGWFDSEIEAAQAYNIAAKEKFGDKAKLNEIPNDNS